MHAALNERAQAQTAFLQVERDAAQASVLVRDDKSISEPVRTGIATAARIVLDSSQCVDPPTSSRHERANTPSVMAAGASRHTSQAATGDVASAPITSLVREFDNGTGGFIEAGRPYAITLQRDYCYAAPWLNVIANASFGFIVSTEGGGYTWSLNSQQNPLTP